MNCTLILTSSTNCLLNFQTQQQSLYVIEVSYNELLLQAEAAVVQMQRRVGSGRVLADFPKRIKQLIASILTEFNKKVSGTIMVRERAERARMLRDYIFSAAIRLFDHQVLIKEAEVFRKAKKELVKIYSTKEGPSTEQIQNLQRKGLFDYRASMSQLEEETLGLTVAEERVTDYSEKLDGLIKEFPESAEAKLIEIKQLEKQVMEKPKKKKKRNAAKMLGISLSLVGMLRPPGFGNLQGFIGYATSLFGLPLDLLLGVQNDGDSPEVSFPVLV